jgi:catechol 2,3-dioxygenase-like lactoylglutathione lyase family enzyme
VREAVPTAGLRAGERHACLVKRWPDAEPRCTTQVRAGAVDRSFWAASSEIDQYVVVEEAIPILRVTAAETSASWYRRLGYEVEWEHRFKPGLPTFVSISRQGSARLFLSEHTGDAPPGGLAYLRVDDLEAVAREFDRPAVRQPWGLEVHLVDPDGNRLRLGEATPVE